MRIALAHGRTPRAASVVVIRPPPSKPKTRFARFARARRAVVPRLPSSAASSMPPYRLSSHFPIILKEKQQEETQQ